MGLADRLKAPTPGSQAVKSAAGGGIGPSIDSEAFQKVKVELHKVVVDRLDFKTLEQLEPEAIRDELRQILGDLLEHFETPVPLNRAERERAVADVMNEITGFGPLEPLLADTTISDILVNTYSTVYIERRGRLELTPVRFRDNKHLHHIINRIVSKVGRHIDESSPMVDARLPDGSRVNAVIQPIAVDGPLVSIRRFGASPLTISSLLGNNSLTQPMVDFLGAAVKAKMNVLVSGGTGSGKTTLLNALSSLIPAQERIVTIEDAAELQLQQPHVVRLETRPANIEGRGEIRSRDLVRNSLRMRPDRIIIGEVRGAEALDMLQAMNTGHDGSMATVHANTPRDALTRVMGMLTMAEASLTETVMCQMVARALHLIVQAARFPDGRRRVVAISEVTGVEGNIISMEDIFLFRQTGTDEEGNTLGYFEAVQVPQCLDKIIRVGIKLDPEMFTRR